MLFGIDVVIIAPGPVKTAIWGKVDQTATLARYDNSAFRAGLQKVLGLTESMENVGCEPEVISQRALAILTSAKPKTRYRIDVQSKQNRFLSMLPTRMADKIIAKQVGLVKK